MLLWKCLQGVRGLKMQQRNCRVVDNIQDELQQQMTEVLNTNNNEEDLVHPDNS